MIKNKKKKKNYETDKMKKFSEAIIFRASFIITIIVSLIIKSLLVNKSQLLI